jgi:hypothetical protein
MLMIVLLWVLMAIAAMVLLSDGADAALEDRSSGRPGMQVVSITCLVFGTLGLLWIHLDALTLTLYRAWIPADLLEGFSALRPYATTGLILLATISFFVVDSAQDYVDWWGDLASALTLPDLWREYARIRPVRWLPRRTRAVGMILLHLFAIGVFWFVLAFLRDAGVLKGRARPRVPMRVRRK